jgi:hypothetical protein
MWQYGFFNSINGDRLYNADQMSKIFEGLITDGVYESVGDKLAVQPNSGMTIQIGTGRGWFNKRWVDNTTPYAITLEASDVTLNRYAAVCVKVDTSDAVRSAEPYIKYSDFASDPVKPTIERSETLNEYCLGYVYIGAGVTEITAEHIEDTRADESLCGWVTGLIEQLSTATLFTQWEAMFNNWFNGLKDIINENTETMLVQALPKETVLTLSADGWTEAESGHSQTLSVQGMTSTKTIISQANEETGEAYATANVKCSTQDTDSITFTAASLPETDIKVDFCYFGV